MYEVDEKDIVVKLEGIPQSDVGAPMPIVLSDELSTLLGYSVLDNIDQDTAEVEDIHETAVIILFEWCMSSMFGSPNDEAIGGHPLYERGLESYGAYEIKHSSWLRKLERMNRVHEHHDPKKFELYRHFILTFHDSTFECIACGFEVIRTEKSWSELIEEMQTILLDHKE